VNANPEGWVEIRFYQELNDFLPGERRGRSSRAAFREGDTVKALIEALGVPHTEVDLILVDGRSVSFAHRLAAGERISVYPVFESFDISRVTRVRPRGLREPRFVLDVHLGRLATALRMLGFDALYSNDCNDETLARLSGEQKRILLTRDRGLLKRRSITHGYLVRSRRPLEQLGEVIRRFDLTGRIRPFSRCPRCNIALEEVPKKETTGRIPPRIGELYDRFKHCPGCGRIFWPGSHWDHMRQRLWALLGGDGPPPPQSNG
jgi:hypothetical protein